MTHFAVKGGMNAKSAKEQRRHDKWQKHNMLKVANRQLSRKNTKIKK